MDGFSGQTGANLIVLLNTIGPGTHFFNGIDLYKSTPSTPSASSSTTAKTATTTNPAFVFLPFLEEANEEEEEEELVNTCKPCKNKIFCPFKHCNIEAPLFNQASR